MVPSSLTQFRHGGVGGEGGLGVNYGNEPDVKQIAIWRTGCKSKFPEPMYRTQCFDIFDQFITICAFLKGGLILKLYSVFRLCLLGM